MSQKRTLSEEEDRLWRQVMKGTRPIGKVVRKAANRVDRSGLHGSHNNRAPSGAAAPATGPTHHGHPPPPKKLSGSPPPIIRRSELPSPKPPTSADLSNLDRKEKQRVLRGKVEIDGKIDLHGMRQNEAHKALIARVSQARMEGKRVLLVVTGKGASKGVSGAGPADGSEPFWARGGGVLKSNVPLWLRQDPLRAMIFSVQQAHQRHGGGGALYVFLKKLR